MHQLRLGGRHYAKRRIMRGKRGISPCRKAQVGVLCVRRNVSLENTEERRTGMITRGGNVCLDKMTRILCPVIVLT